MTLTKNNAAAPSKDGAESMLVTTAARLPHRSGIQAVHFHSPNDSPTRLSGKTISLVCASDYNSCHFAAIG
ncbi:hypothetical protein FNI11_22660 [Salmonella enterica subsp. salamae]|nr:hypothetical protein [Salmonella enterica subsp. salamae]HCC0887119.1 hypothetical protein [Salmonella enterica]ECG8592479.1 hypothetical protein [Salmonella enterica subsp. salamae]ECJ2282455.1 hypothetical protein [Salmonella enterica subsp. salamae]ECJ2283648.1 hypothetical protein [Salmonella enterica subsp. salamae]